jgi:hypothetical protein
VSTIWGWGSDSGILPCPVYLRHCVLAAQKQVSVPVPVGEVALRKETRHCFDFVRRCAHADWDGGQGDPVYSSFLQETYLADRTTTIGEHLRKRPDIMLCTRVLSAWPPAVPLWEVTYRFRGHCVRHAPEAF